MNVTYPRFISVPTTDGDGSGISQPDLLFEMRVGRSGLGDDWMYLYTATKGWNLVGKYLEVSIDK